MISNFNVAQLCTQKAHEVIKNRRQVFIEGTIDKAIKMSDHSASLGEFSCSFPIRDKHL